MKILRILKNICKSFLYGLIPEKGLNVKDAKKKGT